MNILSTTFDEIINHLSEGIIIMDKNRIIQYMNEVARALTGWNMGAKVPYCTYCQQREIDKNENRCILTADDPVPFFHSHMAVYSGIEEEFEMSLKKIKVNNDIYFILRLKRPVDNESLEKIKFHELLVQETMLAQEYERRKIARELHDHIGQSVYSIFLGLEGIRHLVTNSNYDSHLANMVNVMERTLSDIKRLTKNLRPEIVYHLGLKEAVLEAVRDWEELYQVEIQVNIEFNKEECFELERELHLFRILQEAVRNAICHGHASKLTIQLKSSFQYVFFVIQDNGKGFDVQTNNPKKGLGLRHMFERCLMMGGDIRWISKIGGPTKVEGFVSIKKSEGEDVFEPFNC
ncbi:sensor histidine kinase [Neobacillus niacini]|uniref:sensor histidine kinase n=1 Tax=Neobacillus niacini TaxID=86668 RepID=UPI0005EE8B8B|nr:histidine kinase [Neobacillus niacini]